VRVGSKRVGVIHGNVFLMCYQCVPNRFVTVRVGSKRVGVIHGDPSLLSGWALGVEFIVYTYI
jgi:hypothetical protein